MYTVVGNRRSRTTRVLWLLEELGVDYQLSAANPQSDTARAANPSGKIPALIDGEHVFTDSTAIMTYLSDKHGKLTFSAGTPDRGMQDGHTNFLLDEFDACLWMASRHSYSLPEDMRMPAITDSLKWEFARSCERFLARLGAGPFLMGDTMTIADIIAAHCGRWAKNAGFPVSPPEFSAYVERMITRPAFRRALKG